MHETVALIIITGKTLTFSIAPGVIIAINIANNAIDNALTKIAGKTLPINAPEIVPIAQPKYGKQINPQIYRLVMGSLL